MFSVASLFRSWTLVRGESPPEGTSPPLIQQWRDSVGSITIERSHQDAEARHRLSFEGQVSVDVLTYKREVWEAPLGADVPPSTRDHFLVDQVLPRLIADQGKLVLHAAAIRAGNRAILLLGPSGRGKSTLATSFLNAGYPLLGDDATVLSWSDNQAHVQAVYPSLRLMPDSLTTLMPGTAPEGPVAHYSPKQRITVPISDGEKSCVPVRALAIIGEPTGDGTIQIRRVPAAGACMAMIENSFALDPTDVGQARKRMEQSSAVAEAIPAVEICYPRDYSLLGKVRTTILQAVEELEAQ